MRTYHYLHFDVFTDRRFAGNQLAVFLDAEGLAPETMQQIAREMAFPETTFVLPAESADTDVRARIFTPATELPMAGHPTIGTTFALAQTGRLSPDRSQVVLGLGIGPTPVELEWEADELRFAWMTQPIPEFGPTPTDLAGLAAALGVTEADIRATGLPPQQASSGLSFLFVPLASRRAVDAVVVDRTSLKRVCEAAGLAELPVFVFSLDTGDDEATVFSRMFAPMFGIAEDPATGSASGPLGAYLVQRGRVGAEGASRLVSLQGVQMGRPSRIHISIGTRDGRIDSVRVGGTSILVGEGTVRV